MFSSPSGPVGGRQSTGSRKSSTPGKQTTLLQSWGYEGNRHQLCASGVDMFDEDDDDEDALLLAAAEADSSAAHQASLGPSLSESGERTAIEGFDRSAGSTWIYPSNLPERSYQLEISKACLFRNTLVSLPTGLGKTFIAAVVMYNFYRWYPRAKIVFMAPTKPLVAQQIESCFKIMGIPQLDTMEMTGNVSVSVRENAWKQKRVFFLTPQVMCNDLSRGLFPAKEVKLLVVDEAHRAQGDYAYCQVVRELQKANRESFRVVALSATPGTDIAAVKSMMQNLLISHIELRSEDSPDIMQYTFKRSIQKEVVPLGKELTDIKDKFLAVLEHFIRKLYRNSALNRKSVNPTHYTKFGLLQCRNEFRGNPPARLDRTTRGIVEGDFAAAISLYHAYELLLQHGMRAFFNFVEKSTNEKDGNKRLRAELFKLASWNEIHQALKEKFSGDMNNSRLNSSRPNILTQFTGPSQVPVSDMVMGHPKLERLCELVVQHFKDKKEQNIETRVMIFSQYRDSVQEITACLHAFKPLIKVMEFVGQAGTKGKKGLTQKEQIEVVKRFRQGGFNTLVSTCVGEEGLDIGEVDLIVLYDVSKSPIRLVQRMGRTGRKRAGKIIVLVTEGKEAQTYNQSMYNKNTINKAILDKEKLKHALCASPRLVPKDLEPTCQKMNMIVGTYLTSKTGPSSVASRNNRRLSALLSDTTDFATGGKRGKSYRQNAGFLSPAEIQLWEEHFYVPEEKIPRLPERREIWPSSHAPTSDNPFGRQLDLGEWHLWQDEVQPRVFVSQSRVSSLYTSIVSRTLPAMDAPLAIEKTSPHKEVPRASSPLRLSAIDLVDVDDDVMPIEAVDSNVASAKRASSCYPPDWPQFLVTERFDPEFSGPPEHLASTLTDHARLEEAEVDQFTMHLKSLLLGKDQGRFKSPANAASSPPLNAVDANDFSASPCTLVPRKELFDKPACASPFKTSTPLIPKKRTPKGHKHGLVPSSSVAHVEHGHRYTFETHTPSFFKNNDFSLLFDNVGQAKSPNTSPKAVDNLQSTSGSGPTLYSATALVDLLVSEAGESRKVQDKPGASLGFEPSFSADKLSPFPTSPAKVAYDPLDSDDDIFTSLEMPMAATPRARQFHSSRLGEDSSPLQRPIGARAGAKRIGTSESESEGSASKPPVFRAEKKAKAKTNANAYNDFIDMEAMEDSTNCEDGPDETDFDLDGSFDASFVDNATQNVTMGTRAMYLRSVRSPAGQLVRPRMMKPMNRSAIFSQAVVEQDDDYEMDSFCVNNDEEIEYDSRMDTLDLLEKSRAQDKKPARAAVKKEAQCSRKRKRIIRADTSSDEEEPPPISQDKKPKTEISPIAKASDTMAPLCHSDSAAAAAVAAAAKELLIIVANSEVHKLAATVSELRHEQKMNVLVQDIKHATFLVSPRMAVIRKTISDFQNGSNKSKLLAECQELNDLYDRPVIIVEAERLDVAEQGSVPVRSLHSERPRTMLINQIMCQLAMTKIQLLFSEGQTETARTLHNLSEREFRRGKKFPANITRASYETKRQSIDFYQSLPGIGLGHAIKFATSFRKVKDVFTFNASTLMQKSEIEEDKAQGIVDYSTANYYSDMTDTTT